MTFKPLDISISKTAEPKSDPIKRFDDGTVEMVLPNGARRRVRPYKCIECGSEEVQHGLNGGSLMLIHYRLCPFCYHQETMRRAAALEQERKTRLESGLSARMRRYVAQALATPLWCDREAIAAIYAEAKRKTLETGIPHDVDHIYPIQSRYGCGLHVHYNLQVLERTQNYSKGNTFPMHDSPALTKT